MGTGYTMSNVTIIAALSTSCYSGFFRFDLHPLDVKLATPLRSPLRLIARRSIGSGFHRDYFKNSTVNPTDRRGWTFQEELLSTRFVKFTGDDMQWKCSAGTACMCDQPVSLDYMGQSTSSGVQTVERNWHFIVRNFCQRAFTMDTNKLLALSSVAERLEPEFRLSTRTDLRYLAGVWQDELTPSGDLTWYAMEDTGRCPSSYIGPSFSWASVSIDARVEFSNSVGYSHSLCEVVDAGTELVFKRNKFGRASARFLTLRGPLVLCVVSTNFGDREVRLEPGCRLQILNRPYFDCPITQCRLENGRKAVCRSTTSTSFEDTTASVFLLFKSSGSFTTGLVLGRTSDHYPRYQRLGLVNLQVSNGGTELKDLGKWIEVVTYTR